MLLFGLGTAAIQTILGSSLAYRAPGFFLTISSFWVLMFWLIEPYSHLKQLSRIHSTIKDFCHLNNVTVQKNHYTFWKLVLFVEFFNHCVVYSCQATSCVTIRVFMQSHNFEVIINVGLFAVVYSCLCTDRCKGSK